MWVRLPLLLPAFNNFYNNDKVNMISYEDIFQPTPLSRQDLTVDATVGGVALTVPSRARMAQCRLETAQIRFTVDTTPPTSVVGTQLEVGDTLELSNKTELLQARFIRTGGTSGTLHVEYFSAP